MKGQLLFALSILFLTLSTGQQSFAKQAQQTTAVPRSVKIRLEWQRVVPTPDKSNTPDSEIFEVSGTEGATLVTSNPVQMGSSGSYRQCIVNPTVAPDGTFSLNLSIYEWAERAEGPSERIERLTTTINVANAETKEILTRQATLDGKLFVKHTLTVTPMIVK